jgi:hypothetical protein
MDFGVSDDYLDDETSRRPMQDEFDRIAAELRSEADGTVFTDLTEAAVARVSRPRLTGRLRRRAATITAAFVLAFGGLGGVAYAANGAAPGDFLFGLDRALEAVGIGNGGSAERLAEVHALVEAGNAGQGLEHATDSLLPAPELAGSDEARDALLAAAERIAQLSLGEAAGPPEGVADLLTYLSENLDDLDGQAVAELAKAIASNESAGPPEGVPVGPPEDLPPGPPIPTPGPPVSTP